VLEIINKKLSARGYIRSGFECYSLPDSPMTKAFEDGTAHYGASGHQTGGPVNFIAVGSSATSNLGDDYYSQNFYDITTYKKCIDKGKLPTFRGMKLSKDDQIRQYATQQLRSYFKIDFKNFEKNFGVDIKEYFSKEIEYLDGMIKDGLVIVSDNGIEMTLLGRDFSQNISNVFDKYDPPTKSYNERLATIKKAKEEQAKLQEPI
jgi:oxygen-independent coproporphyrinogen-3 oxidase